MRAILHLGARRFEIGSAAPRAGAEGAVRFLDPMDALAWLRRATLDPVNLIELRLRWATRPSVYASPQRDDEDLLRGLAGEIAAGRVVVREAPRVNLGSLDGEARESQEEAPASARKPVELTWITIELVGENHKSIPGQRYRVELPDGSVHEGRLDAGGLARLRGITPGECVVTFPDLDEEAWAPIGTTAQP